MPKESKDSKNEAKRFSFAQKSVALTCSAWRTTKLPQAEFASWFVNNFVEGQPWGPVDDWCASQELHKDGTVHWHAYLAFHARYQSADAARLFDREAPDARNTHPQIKSCRSPKAWCGYVQKDGDFCGTVAAVPKKEPWQGYLRKKADREAYEADKAYAGLLELPQERLAAAPFGMNLALVGKQRHYWIVGPPDLGKTRDIQAFFAGSRSAYMRASSKKYPYEGYLDEPFIICDDQFPSLLEVIDVSNTYQLRRERWGESRYTRGYWKAGAQRTLIVTTNRPPRYVDAPAFRARFHVIDLTPPLPRRGGFPVPFIV